MCCVLFEHCRFCLRDKRPEVWECPNSKNARPCAERQKIRNGITSRKGSTVPTKHAILALQNVHARITCLSCTKLVRLVLRLIPEREGGKDIATRPSFYHLGTYYCPGLLDAVFTAATLGLRELEKRLRNAEPTERWNAVIQDYDTSHFKVMEGEVNHLANNELMRRLDFATAAETRRIQTNMHELDQLLSDNAERADLRRKITLRGILHNQIHCDTFNDYRVLCDSDNAPIEHVRLALKVATNGLLSTHSVHIDDIMMRRADWLDFESNPARAQKPPIAALMFRWVDIALGKVVITSSPRTPTNEQGGVRLY
jgi:hypothetical protein